MRHTSHIRTRSHALAHAGHCDCRDSAAQGESRQRLVVADTACRYVHYTMRLTHRTITSTVVEGSLRPPNGRGCRLQYSYGTIRPGPRQDQAASTPRRAAGLEASRSLQVSRAAVCEHSKAPPSALHLTYSIQRRLDAGAAILLRIGYLWLPSSAGWRPLSRLPPHDRGVAAIDRHQQWTRWPASPPSTSRHASHTKSTSVSMARAESPYLTSNSGSRSQSCTPSFWSKSCTRRPGSSSPRRGVVARGTSAPPERASRVGEALRRAGR